MSVRIINGDCIEEMRKLPAQSVHCCVTSPPYWGLRDYGIPPSVWGGRADCAHEWGTGLRHIGGSGLQGTTSQRAGRANVGAQETVRNAGKFCVHCNAWQGCHGLEPTPDLFIEHEVLIFREVWRVLRDDGTLWVNLGDSYTDGGRGKDANSTLEGSRNNQSESRKACTRQMFKGIKPKNLIGVPWRVALALQTDGWYLRSDIIWHKPNPMPESVTDRPTKAHEYIFLLTKAERYFFDAEAIKEPVTGGSKPRRSYKTPDGWDTSSGTGTHGMFHREGRETGKRDYEHKRAPGVTPKSAAEGSGIKQNESFSAAVVDLVDNRNKRDVWTVPEDEFAQFLQWKSERADEKTDVWRVPGFSYKEAHFATFPPALIRPCILAGCPKGGTVLDIFGGSGTTGEVSEMEGRNSILIERNPEYVGLAERRTAQAGLLHSA